MGTSLTNRNYYDISLSTYTFIADDGVVDVVDGNGNQGTFNFYVDMSRTTSEITFNPQGYDTLTFDCPVVFSTKQRANTSAANTGNGKSITILGNVEFRKGIRFETHGRASTSSGQLSKIYLGDNIENSGSLTMTCRYVDAESEQNIPLDVNGYGQLHLQLGSTIRVHAQGLSDTAIGQFTTVNPPVKYNIRQSLNGDNVPVSRIQLYFGEDMLNKTAVSMRQMVVYPDSAPLAYDLHLTANVNITLEDFPSAASPYHTTMYVTAADARVTAEFLNTARMYIPAGAKLTFIESTFGSLDDQFSPLIDFYGDGTLSFEAENPDDLSTPFSGNMLYPLQGGVIMTGDVTNLVTSRFSHVVLPEIYEFDETPYHYEGFTFDLNHAGSDYDFGDFDNKPLYLNAISSDNTTIVTVNANHGVYLYADADAGVGFRNCVIYASEDGLNDSYAFKKDGPGSYVFLEGVDPSGNTDSTYNNKLLVGHDRYFIHDINLNESTTYQNIGEEFCKFYLLADFSIVSIDSSATEFVFNAEDYNANDLYWMSSQGVYLGTQYGIYDITTDFLVYKDGSTLYLNTDVSRPHGGTGLTIKNDTSGEFSCSQAMLRGNVGAAGHGRLFIDTNSCNLSVYSMNFYDCNYVMSPLLIGDNATGVSFTSNVNFYMSASNITYICNDKISYVSDRSYTRIYLSADAEDKTYDFDIAVNDTTSEPPFVYNNDGWYTTPIKFQDSDQYRLVNVNSSGLYMYNTNSPTVELYSTYPVTVYNDVETLDGSGNPITDEVFTFHPDSELSNFGDSTTGPIIAVTNDQNMRLVVDDITIHVYGYGTIHKIGSGDIFMGELHRADMSAEDYTQEIDPSSYQEEWFGDMAPFIDENILAGDKSSENRLIASRWDDLGGDIFDDWGYFYFYDPSLGKYYFPIFDPMNRPSGVINTQVFEVFGRTFTVDHGWAASGVFKIDITSSTSDPFRFGAYGNMGSDGSTIYEHLTYDGGDMTMYYHHNWENNNPNEHFYSYFIPHEESERLTRTYRVGYEQDEGEVGNDNMNIISNEVTNGLTVYFSKTYDVHDWVYNNYINGTSGYVNNYGGDSVDLHYYNNNYDFSAANLVPNIEYNNTINLHEGVFNFVNATSRLEFDTDTDGNINIGELSGGTAFTHGITLDHDHSGTVTFDNVQYDMSTNTGYLLLTGSGPVNFIDTTIVCHEGVSANVIRVEGTDLTISSGTYTNNGTGIYLRVGENGSLTAENVTLTNVNGSLIYSECDDSDGLNFNTVVFDNRTDTPTIQQRYGDASISVTDCTFVMSVSRDGAVIEMGNDVSTVNGNLSLSGCTIDASGAYTYFMKTYTSGYIETADTVMNATNTNVLWPTLRNSLERYLNDTNQPKPYTCDPYNFSGDYGYIAYSYDPTITTEFIHSDDGMHRDLSDGTISSYDAYAAYGHLPEDSSSLSLGETDADAYLIHTGTLSCTRFVDMLGDTHTTNLNQIFTEEVFVAGYVGSINEGNIESFTLMRLGSRVVTMDVQFQNSANKYIGDSEYSIEYPVPVSGPALHGVVADIRPLEAFNYEIVETSSPPTIFINADNVAVTDVIDVPFEVPIALKKIDPSGGETEWGYALPIYIVPVTNNIIQYFQFLNNNDTYVDFNTYTGYPNTSNRTLLQRLDPGATTGSFYVKYVGSGVYYEPEEGDTPANASFDILLYGDGNNDTLLYSTADNDTSVIVVNETLSLKHPLAYVGSFSLDPSNNQTVTLYASGDEAAGADTTVTLERPTTDPADFLIVHEFTLKFRMPLYTYDDTDQVARIEGIDVYETGNVSYSFSSPSGCTISSTSGNSVTLSTFTGGNDDVSEKTIDVRVEISEITSSHGGTVYFKRQDYPIRFELSSLKSFKGINSSNQVYEVEPTVQTANSYFNFPNLIIVRTSEGTYDDTSMPPSINIQKGSSEAIEIITAGIITDDTPGMSDDTLDIAVLVTPSKNSLIMPVVTDPDNNIISVNRGSYSGSILITFSDNDMISGAGSYYTVTFDEELYATVDSVTYIDTGYSGYDGSGNGIPRVHTITHTLGIQPGTRVLITSNHSSSGADASEQVPSVFSVSSTDVSGNDTDVILPNSYLIALPISSYTNFMPYNTTSGEGESFTVNYKLVGIVSDIDSSTNVLVEGVDYEIFDEPPDETTGNAPDTMPGYIEINSDNYYGEAEIRYFFLRTQAYQYVDVYVYYTGVSGTGLADISSINTISAVKIGRYNFDIAPPVTLNGLTLNVGAWNFSVGLNGALILEYRGGEGSDEQIGAKYIFPRTGTIEYIPSQN